MGKYWYDDYPGVFRAEIETLQHGLHEFEWLQELPREQNQGLIQVIGNLRLNENDKQLIRIIFPYGYPYSPPHVIPLHTNGQPKFFGRGNQYGKGKMCLFRDEDEWVPFEHGVGMIIQQAARWVNTANSPEGFTEDLIVVEHAEAIGHVGQVLSYLPAGIPEGEIGMLILKSFKDNYYSLLQIQMKAADSINVVESMRDGSIMAPRQNSLIVGQCYRVRVNDTKNFLASVQNAEIFKHFLADNLNVQVGDLLPDPDVNAKKTIVGFITTETEELHCFQLVYWIREGQTRFKVEYLLLKNLSEELFVRVNDLFDVKSLMSKRVLIVGLGSIGSEVAKELASSGVGKYILLDPEVFDAGNTVRHAADLLSLGDSKVEIVKKIIQAKNPQAQVSAIQGSLFDVSLEVLEEKLGKIDIVLDLTANRLVEDYLNQKFFIERKTPIIQAAVSKGALTGIVLALVPGKSRCLTCLREEKLNHVPTAIQNVDQLEALPPDYGACSQPALPGSGIDTREVALQAARVTLQNLLAEIESFYPQAVGYQYYWHGPSGSKDGTKKGKPFEWEITTVKPLENCKNCNPE